VQEILIILDDPSVHVAGDGTLTPTVYVTFDLVLETRVLLP
jgi:hypothetical protein